MTTTNSELPIGERIEIVSARISTLEVVISGLQNGLSFEWVKQYPDTRQQELNDYTSKRASLLVEKESLQALGY